MNNPTLQWLGQSFIKIISSHGVVIYVDPWINFPPGNALFPKETKLENPDIIFVTHGHLDHLGDTVEIAKNNLSNPEFTIISNFEIMIYLLEQGIPMEHLVSTNIGGTIVKQGISFSLVPAIHSSGIGGFGPKHLTEGGTAGGVVIALQEQVTIYHAGDTDLFSDMSLITKRHHPNVALLPIGGIYTMDPEGAAQATALIHPSLVIPIHYGGTFQLPGTPEEFSTAVKQLAGENVEIKAITPGQTIDLAPYATRT